MKKYLMMGLATLAFAACVSDKEVTVQTQEEKYEKAFEQLVGGPVNANVNWGFDAQQVAAFDADGKLQILNGRYGPYIAFDGKNYRIAKSLHPRAAELTFDECMAIIEKQKK